MVRIKGKSFDSENLNTLYEVTIKFSLHCILSDIKWTQRMIL